MGAFISILQKVIIELFDDVLKPVLIEVAKFVINSLIDIIVDTFSWVFYFCWTAILKMVAVLSDAFEYFAGTSRGMVNGDQTVLEVMFSLDIVSRLFIVFTAVGVGLSIIFSIISVIKSMSDMTLDDKNPISKVFKNSLKSLGTFVIIPLLCIFMLRLSTIIVDTIDYTVNEDDRVTVDRIIWYNCSLNASTHDNLNLNSNKMTEEQKETLLSKEENTRKKYYKATNGSSVPLSYMYDDVRGTSDFSFDFGKFDYVQGFAASIIMVLVLLGCIMVFVARLFELIALYIVGPMFAATIANDGGEMYKQWKDMFIAKFVGGYGMVLGMRLYLIVVPVISRGTIIFTSSDVAGFDGKFNAFVQLLLIVGGGYAVYKSQHMILRLLSVEATSQAQQSAGMLLGMAGAAGSSMIASGTMFGKGIKAAFGGDKENQDNQGKKDNDKGSTAGSFGGSSGSGNMYRDGRPE